MERNEPAALLASLLLASVALTACGGEAPARTSCVTDVDCIGMGASSVCGAAGRCEMGMNDAGSVADAGLRCTSNADCDDGTYCNGTEVCDPGVGGADARGCVAGGEPCISGESCEEARRLCVSLDCANPDRDGDGYARVGCEGLGSSGDGDCDDGDPSINPGEVEVCFRAVQDMSGTVTGYELDPVAATRNEDCDPCTVAQGTLTDGDGDADGFPSTSCTNTIQVTTTPPSCDLVRLTVDPVRSEVRGRDCDDAVASINPNQSEVCNNLDDDCDGAVDNNASDARTYYADTDNDGFGAGQAIVTCPATASAMRYVDNNTDCDPDDRFTYPGAPERCDRRINDCAASGGGGVRSLEDQDNDGHSPGDGSGSCQDGFPEDDCSDLDANVFPGQAQYFTSPRCPDGEAYRSCRYAVWGSPTPQLRCVSNSMGGCADCTVEDGTSATPTTTCPSDTTFCGCTNGPRRCITSTTPCLGCRDGDGSDPTFSARFGGWGCRSGEHICYCDVETFRTVQSCFGGTGSCMLNEPSDAVAPTVFDYDCDNRLEHPRVFEPLNYACANGSVCPSLGGRCSTEDYCVTSLGVTGDACRNLSGWDYTPPGPPPPAECTMSVMAYHYDCNMRYGPASSSSRRCYCLRSSSQQAVAGCR